MLQIISGYYANAKSRAKSHELKNNYENTEARYKTPCLLSIRPSGLEGLVTACRVFHHSGGLNSFFHGIPWIQYRSSSLSDGSATIVKNGFCVLVTCELISRGRN
ncbi:hypothetical protein M514_08597 [Trichuris suis]|uniref:Uncharacterized protein n=1 Tax=Trichuris suis TaxID=68888 RepID=A0A085LZY3_9BILA|nr:hypothetical protein M513_08597 [Trichuris suis]KFD63437.1 hypothetical protein M514_08597 [Trichuris suis]